MVPPGGIVTACSNGTVEARVSLVISGLPGSFSSDNVCRLAASIAGNTLCSIVVVRGVVAATAFFVKKRYSVSTDCAGSIRLSTTTGTAERLSGVCNSDMIPCRLVPIFPAISFVDGFAISADELANPLTADVPVASRASISATLVALPAELPPPASAERACRWRNTEAPIATNAPTIRAGAHPRPTSFRTIASATPTTMGIRVLREDFISIANL